MLVGAPVTAPASPSRVPPPERQLTPEQRLVLDEWARNLARDSALVSAGLLSPDEADTLRLVGLRERRECGEMAEGDFYRARAEVHGRRVARRVRLHAAGRIEEKELRDAELDLAEAQAEVSGDAGAYTVAWQEHLQWLQESAAILLEAGRLSDGQARERVELFLRTRPWPPGTAAQAGRTLTPYLSSRWGWVDALVGGPRGVERVRMRFGRGPPLQDGQEIRLWRGDIPIAEIRVVDIDRDTGVVLADVLSTLPGGEPRVGDIATSD